MRILVVEDHEKLARALKKGLEQDGFAVDLVHDGELAMRLLESSYANYDLVILDLMLPSLDGLSICRNMRQLGILLPVLMLTARDGLEDKIVGLNIGADDYLVKPFDFPELTARVKALLRRPIGSYADELSIHGITLNPSSHLVTRHGKEVSLTAKEFAILEQFMRHPGEVLTRGQIINHVWDFAYDSSSNIIDVHVKNLRKKIQKKNETLFETIHGVGYSLRA